MPPLFFAAAAAFAACLLLTPLVRRWARPRSARLEEHPGRRGGQVEVPRLGGLAVWAACGLALVGAYALRMPVGLQLAERTHLRALVGPLLLVVLTGAVDDRRGLPAKMKLALQTVAALWVAASGVRVTELFFHRLPVPVSIAMTALWLVGCSNAFNLIDGLDGLATGLALFADTTLLAHAVLSGQPGLALLSGALFGALAAFLLFNFPPATIYLGDAGSLSIGFFLGCISLLWFDKATTAVGLLAPVLALLVPMTDTTVAILRRGLSGEPLFAPDRRHLHHRLLDLGLKPRTATLALYAIAVLGAVVALTLEDLQRHETSGLAVLLLVGLVAVGIHQMRYIEFAQAGRMLRRGVFEHTKVIHAHVSLGAWVEGAASAGDYAALGAGLRALGAEMGFAAVELAVGAAGESVWLRRYDCGAAGDELEGWSVQIAVGAGGELGRARFWCARDRGNPVFMHELAAAVEQGLAPALLRLREPAARAQAGGS